jgi:hypothetical protein
MIGQVIADTSVWVRYFRGIECSEVALPDNLIANDEVLLIQILFQEIRQGVLNENEYQKITGLLDSLKHYKENIKPISILAANIYRLRQ